MSRMNVDFTVTVTLNDEPEVTDLALARELARRLQAIASEPRYQDVVLWSIAPDHEIFDESWDRSAYTDDE